MVSANSPQMFSCLASNSSDMEQVLYFKYMAEILHAKDNKMGGGSYATQNLPKCARAYETVCCSTWGQYVPTAL